MRFLLAILVIGFCAGLVFLARFSSGSSYPRYSSLGTDPMGTDVLFESLNRSGKASAVRNYLPLDQLRARNATVLYLGASPYWFEAANDRSFAPLEAIARQGNRVVVGITDQYLRGLTINGAVLQRGSRRDNRATTNRWDIRVKGEKTKGTLAEKYMIEPGHEWQPALEPRMWERNFGPGTIVLMSDGNRLTNQSLANDDSHNELVPALLAGRTTVIFDESHLGVVETGSIAALVRRYRLEGLIAGLLLLTAMFLWRSATRFPPPPEEAETEAVLIGSESPSMLAGLLERHIAPETLIEVCVAEWNRVRPGKRVDASAWRRADPLHAYRQIQARLQDRKNRTL